MIDFIFNLEPGDVVYDIETYPNIFTLYAIHTVTKQEWIFEISDRKDETRMLVLFMNTLKRLGCRMVGFNNIGFDYPVIHQIYQCEDFITVDDIYKKAMAIIGNYKDKFAHIIWDNKQVVPQLDLFKIHHFDNFARATSLKVLEFNMRSDSIQELPVPLGINLNDEQKEELIKYNRHDVLETMKFYERSRDNIRFREELSKKYDKNFLNHNDTKIGKDYFIMRLEEHKPGSCYRKVDGKRSAVQSKRDRIHLRDVILPTIKFQHPEFNRILEFFENTTIVETKGVFKNLSCTINGFKFVFGTGGIHGSVDNQSIESDDDYVIEDWDVKSYYPNLSITNELYPEHLGKEFCTIYKDVYEQRTKYAKGTSENEMLKLALNGVYGDSNNEYSPFFDPQYTMAITVNGQLLLCMLAEMFIDSSCLFVRDILKRNELKILQINTDGITIRYRRVDQVWVHHKMTSWERDTGLTLEHSEYSRMFIRDVNSYIAEYKDGTVKRKGAYEYELDWHQNHSALVVPKAAEAYLLHGTNIGTFIRTHGDVMDFMLRTKVRRSDILEYGGEEVQRITRYYVSTDGDYLEKTAPARGKVGAWKRKNKLTDAYFLEISKQVGDDWDDRIHTKGKTTYHEEKTKIHSNWTVQICNDISDSTFTDIDYDYYIQEAEKLVEGLR